MPDDCELPIGGAPAPAPAKMGAGIGRESADRDGQRPEPLHDLAGSLAQLSAAFCRLAQVRADQALLRVRERISRFALQIGLALAAVLVAVVGAVYVIHGLALGLASLCGGRLWLGYLLAGLVCVGGAAAFITISGRRREADEWQELLEKYGPAEAEEKPDEPANTQSQSGIPRATGASGAGRDGAGAG